MYKPKSFTSGSGLIRHSDKLNNNRYSIGTYLIDDEEYKSGLLKFSNKLSNLPHFDIEF